MRFKATIIIIPFSILATLFNPLFGQTTVPQIDTLQVVVDKHKISLFAAGSGKYTVILEAGGASNHKCWNKIFPEIAKLTRVISYDRPGYLKSEICTKQRDAITIATELKKALDAGGFSPPFIIAGWSMGGAFARVFCGLYPKSVVGLILVDPTPEEVYSRVENEYPELLADDSLYMKELLASTDRPGERAENIVFDTSMNQARISDIRHTTPTILLVATEGKAPGDKENDPVHPMNRLWVEELVIWAKKRPNLKYSIVEKCGHHIAKQKPELVVQAISEMLDRNK